MSKKARPRRARIKDVAGKGQYPARSGLYALAGKHVGLFEKFGDITLINLDKLDDIIEAGVRPAKIKIYASKAKVAKPVAEEAQP
jgi:hypothetical protein